VLRTAQSEGHEYTRVYSDFVGVAAFSGAPVSPNKERIR
jgi:hypothetical protein